MRTGCVSWQRMRSSRQIMHSSFIRCNCFARLRAHLRQRPRRRQRPHRERPRRERPRRSQRPCRLGWITPQRSCWSSLSRARHSRPPRRRSRYSPPPRRMSRSPPCLPRRRRRLPTQMRCRRRCRRHGLRCRPKAKTVAMAPTTTGTRTRRRLAGLSQHGTSCVRLTIGARLLQRRAHHALTSRRACTAPPLQRWLAGSQAAVPCAACRACDERETTRLKSA
mmetsp:Transcript_14613/g.34622  ORF Transcript_14613/g.34622 Transcript_14613/m.34622 type:complete len:222 (+) Transcript_14613:1158-1823(+)